MRFKKFIFIMIIVIALTGCKNNNELVCTNTKPSAGVDTKQTITVKFKDDKVNSLVLKVIINPTNDKIKKYWDTFIEELNKQYSIYDEISGVKVIKTTDDKKYKYTITIDIDLNSVEDDGINTLGLSDIIDSKLKKEDIKKSIENKGFTCN